MPDIANHVLEYEVLFLDMQVCFTESGNTFAPLTVEQKATKGIKMQIATYLFSK